MKLNLYPKLAFDSIRKNRRLYVPYILTCIGMVVMYYIIGFLKYFSGLETVPHSEIISEFLIMGEFVIAIFAGIFLFYTNSFLIRRRKREFGLYNILGMGKNALTLIIFWETVIIAAISLAIGIPAGIILSKLAELCFVNILQGDVNYSLSVAPAAVLSTFEVFGIIFLLLFISSVLKTRFSTAISLVRSENVGEKPPKANWLLGILGIVLLGGAYYIAVVTENPIAAIFLFFVAVVMVIIGTYLVMISGSVLLCRILQKNKSYYYKPNHFVSLSSMVYRMKRNGAGLASICILATMVLVMISSTASLYYGNENALMRQYPREMDTYYYMNGIEDLSDENIGRLREKLNGYHSEHGLVPQNVIECRQICVAGYLKDGTVETDVSLFDTSEIKIVDEGITEFIFSSLEDYNRIYGTDYSLNDGEALIFTVHGDYSGDTVSFNNGRTLKIVGSVKDYSIDVDAMVSIIPSVVLVVPDLGKAVEGLDRLATYNGDPMLSYQWVYCFDMGLEPEEQIAYGRDFWRFCYDLRTENSDDFVSITANIREIDRSDFLTLYGGLFFLGLMLSAVFIFAAVLIIYYKQISEGYEDRSRFEIMKKVGMTDRDIRKSINSQLLTVFFLPLAFAALHLGFALPIISRLLLLFNLRNIPLFYLVAAGCFAIFALCYALVYKITSHSYYKIVIGAKEGRS